MNIWTDFFIWWWQLKSTKFRQELVKWTLRQN